MSRIGERRLLEGKHLLSVKHLLEPRGQTSFSSHGCSCQFSAACTSFKQMQPGYTEQCPYGLWQQGFSMCTGLHAKGTTQPRSAEELMRVSDQQKMKPGGEWCLIQKVAKLAHPVAHGQYGNPALFWISFLPCFILFPDSSLGSFSQISYSHVIANFMCQLGQALVPDM